jgi:hypothetical protein
MKVRQTHNPKKRLRKAPTTELERKSLDELSARVTYGGNPDHKRDPGDYGLQPPSRPRLGKSLCDTIGKLRKAHAQKLLQDGVKRGCVSVQEENGWPRVVWAVHESRAVLEARLDNAVQGTYHGYPLESDDPFAGVVLKYWGDV